MRDIEYVLDFIVNLGRKQIMNGASLERVNNMIGSVCLSYGLHSVSIFSLNSFLMVSAKDKEGYFASRQIAVPSFGIHLERLRSLNQLSLSVCEEKPEPKMLQDKLQQAEQVKEYPILSAVLGQALACASLAFIFGGSWKDALSASLIIMLLFYVLIALGKTGINKIITNTLSAFIVGTLATFFVHTGLAENFFTIIIADTMLIIPGIPMVNATRNLLCGNEMNGILQFFKVLLESITLVLGLVLSIYFFGGFMP